MFPNLCPVCHYLTYKEESGEYYSYGMKISPDEGYCSHCEFRYSEHVKHPTEEQVKKHIKWLRKMSKVYIEAIERRNNEYERSDRKAKNETIKLITQINKEVKELLEMLEKGGK